MGCYIYAISKCFYIIRISDSYFRNNNTIKCDSHTDANGWPKILILNNSINHILSNPSTISHLLTTCILKPAKVFTILILFTCKLDHPKTN